MDFTVKTIEEKDLMILNGDSASSIGLENLKVTVARFGFGIADINIKLNNNLHDGEIQLSANIINSLKLPITNKVLVKVENKEVVFGPYIGIYLGSGRLNIGWKYERLASFVKEFKENINGAMIAFTENDIDYGTLRVNAYSYNSEKDIWRKEYVPLPAVIHRYGDMNKRVRNRLRSLYGNNLFNYDEMDKWAEISALKSNPDTKEYIPHTILCTNNEQFEKFVSSYDDVYFKPVKGRKGRGIHRIFKNNEKYNVTVQSRKSFEEKEFESIKDLVDFLSDKINSGDYILQKTIKLTISNRVIDFRIRFEKDIDNNWIQSIFAARVSDLGGVVSNRSAGGEVISPYDALTKYYNFSSEEAKKYKKELINAGHKITKAVESAHINYGKCAVDLGLESDGTIYHIESNVKAPNDLTTRSFEGFHGLDRVCILNTNYAKLLSGFKDIQTTFTFEDRLKETLYDDQKKTYNIIVGSSSRDKALVEKIDKLFLEKYISIEDRLTRNFHLDFNVEATEQDLLDIFNQIRIIDSNKSIRTILYNQLKSKKRQSVSKNTHKIKRLERENAQLLKKLNQMEKSTSWKLSRPIRLLGGLLKR